MEKSFLFETLGTRVIYIFILSVTLLALSTCSVENIRAARWQNELGWKPDENTRIFPLEAGQSTPMIKLKGECYKYRIFPKNNQIKTEYWHSGWRALPFNCDTNRCPNRRFTLKNTGYFFINSRSKSSYDYICKRWAASNDGSKRQKTSYEIQSVFINGGYGQRTYTARIAHRRDCIADNRVKGVLRQRGSNGDWVYKNPHTFGQSVKVWFFDDTGGGCSASFRRLRNAGVL